jgi:hypothetical protein
LNSPSRTIFDAGGHHLDEHVVVTDRRLWEVCGLQAVLAVGIDDERLHVSLP